MERSRFIFESAYDGIFDLHNHRRVLKFIVVVTLLTMLPLIIKNYYIEETALATLLLTFEISLMIEVYGILYKQKPILGYFVPLGLLAVSIVVSVYTFGTLATYWTFPIITAVVFIIPRKAALMVNSFIIAGTCIAAFQHQEAIVTLRFGLALLCCATISHFAIEAVRKLQHDLRYLSTRDSLTGALNRHQLDDYLEDASRENELGTVGSMAIIDIDHFKQVNDQYGHDVGDEIIKIVVELINQNSRQRDLLFRLGGDEFLLLFNNTPKEKAHQIVSSIAHKVRTKQYPQQAKVTLSIGIAESIAEQDIEQWFKRADVALYEAKHAGRNTIHQDQVVSPPTPSNVSV